MSRVTCLVAHLGQVHDRHAPGTKRTHHAVLADFLEHVAATHGSIVPLIPNSVHIMLHAGRATRLNTKWYDNVVIAKRYIGPMAAR